MSFPRYEQYKESGVDWLGEIPSDWNVVALKYLVSLKSGDGITGESIEDAGEYPVYGGNGLRGYTSAFTHDGEFVVIGRQGALCGNINYASGKFWASEHAVVALPIQPVDTFWLGEMLRAMNLNQYSVSAAQPGLSMELVGNIRTVLPPKDVQSAISAFLWRETSKIDALVAEQRRLIELLKEKRQAVISHAVTKGLDPNVKMKPSGIEWLGDVPEHWEATAIKRMCQVITDGAHISPETENGEYCFVSTKDVSDDGIDFGKCLKTSASSYEYLVRAGCKPFVNDVLFSKDGTIGRTVVIEEDRDFVVASSLIIIRPIHDMLDPQYLHLLCQSIFVKHQVEQFVRGAGLPRISITNLCKVVGCFPPKNEQREIGRFLHYKVQEFRRLQAEAERAITLLQERRTALISAAVTGKIDVRGFEPISSNKC